MRGPNENRPTPPVLHARAADWKAAAEEVLGRVREVARRITARVNRVLDDTRTDHPALHGDGTAGFPSAG
jgi:hypothetical protein